MRNRAIEISGLRFVSATQREQATGLLGWLSFVVNEVLQLDGVTLRRTLSGRLALSFPARRDRSGVEHAFVRPLNQEVRREVESQVLPQLERLLAGQEARL